MTRRFDAAGLAAPLLAVAAWELLIRARVLTFTYLPAPSAIVAAGRDLLLHGGLLGALLHTAAVTLLAWALASAAALALGTALGLSATAARFSMASVEVLRTLPAVALVPVALLVAGPTTGAETMVAAYAAAWPLVIGVAAGLRAAPRRLLDVARQFELSRTRVVLSLLLPAAAPLVLAAARLSLGISLIVVVLTEMVGTPQGLGAGIAENQTALRPDAMWVYVLLVAALGAGLNAVLLPAARRAVPSLRAGRAA
ncbi:ABC transporter permease [Actinomadura parmotrematis]|uniref:ABC transporter permease subunit n=1 Tax=Actinomadura parmotrematis TaxID=2864039 RepID=A0ABS7G4R3_9ACTN|nr:ABC transporter permease subunit [Actinomadura parmotrematis]MBW8487215.1 ABC transporter permease subunit [Actinomadura parmotrematis]